MAVLAVVGAGYWGENLVRTFQALGALKYVVETREERHALILQSYPGIRVTASYDEALADPQVDGIVIALPAERHHEFAKKALEHDKDVFVEKPLALRLDDAYELRELARVRGRILMVGHLLRYHPAFVKIRELAHQGALGRLQYIYSNRLSLGKIRREENALWSFAPHDISMILALCGEQPALIRAWEASYLHKEVADVTVTHLAFPSGINSHIFVSWLHPFKEQKLVVVADDKMAVFEDTQPWDKKVTLYSHHISWQNNAPVPEKAEAEYVPVEPSEPLVIECSHFLTCIQSRAKPLTDADEGIRVLQVLDRAQTHLRDNRARGSIPCTPPCGYTAHETACIDQPCSIGTGTKIWHFSHVMSSAIIGERCILGQNVHIAGGVRIGNNVKIQNNVSVYTGTIVEDDVFLGPSCVLTNVKNPRSEIARHSLYESTLIKRGATIGANATIVCGTTIGRFAFIAAGSTVTGDVPDYALMAGVPARRIGWMSRHGHRLSTPDAHGVMTCPEGNLRYREVTSGCLRCLDVSEDDDVPPTPGCEQHSYDWYKQKAGRIAP